MWACVFTLNNHYIIIIDIWYWRMILFLFSIVPPFLPPQNPNQFTQNDTESRQVCTFTRYYFGFIIPDLIPTCLYLGHDYSKVLHSFNPNECLIEIQSRSYTSIREYRLQAKQRVYDRRLSHKTEDEVGGGGKSLISFPLLLWFTFGSRKTEYHIYTIKYIDN